MIDLYKCSSFAAKETENRSTFVKCTCEMCDNINVKICRYVVIDCLKYYFLCKTF